MFLHNSVVFPDNGEITRNGSLSIESDKLAVFPAFFRVSGAKLAVFGDGDEAFAKARLIANTSATIIAFTQDPAPAYAAFLKRKTIEIDPSPFSPDLLAGMKLVFAATGDGAADRMIVEAARLQKFRPMPSTSRIIVISIRQLLSIVRRLRWQLARKVWGRCWPR